MREAILQKQVKVSEIKEKISAAKALVLTEYRGLKVKEMQQLRDNCREKGIEYVVLKNSLAKRAIEGGQYEPLSDYLFGPTGIAFSREDPVSLAKTLMEFSKEHKDFKIKVGSIEGEVLETGDLIQVSNLPSKEVLLSKLLRSLSSPIVGFLNVLNGPLRGLVYTLKAISEQKEKKL